MIEILAKLGNLPGALPGACAQGIIWGIMAIGVYITYRILDVADLTVDGSMGTGGAVCIMLLLSGHNVWFALFMALVAGLLTGQDVIAQLRDKPLGDHILIPVNMLRHGGDVFLDDLTVGDLERALHRPVTVVEQDGFSLVDALFCQDLKEGSERG